jgi:hypothetical protein
MTIYTDNLIWQRMRSLCHQAAQQGITIDPADLYALAADSLRRERLQEVQA